MLHKRYILWKQCLRWCLRACVCCIADVLIPGFEYDTLNSTGKIIGKKTIFCLCIRHNNSLSQNTIYDSVPGDKYNKYKKVMSITTTSMFFILLTQSPPVSLGLQGLYSATNYADNILGRFTIILKKQITRVLHISVIESGQYWFR